MKSVLFGTRTTSPSAFGQSPEVVVHELSRKCHCYQITLVFKKQNKTVQNKSSAFPPGVLNWCCWSWQERDGEQQPTRDWCKGEGKISVNAGHIGQDGKETSCEVTVFWAFLHCRFLFSTEPPAEPCTSFEREGLEVWPSSESIHSTLPLPHRIL